MTDTPTETLLEQTLRLLKQDSRTIAELNRASGLNYFWLRKMKAGAIRNPGVSTVERLHKFLTTEHVHGVLLVSMVDPVTNTRF